MKLKPTDYQEWGGNKKRHSLVYTKPWLDQGKHQVKPLKKQTIQNNAPRISIGAYRVF